MLKFLQNLNSTFILVTSWWLFPTKLDMVSFHVIWLLAGHIVHEAVMENTEKLISASEGTYTDFVEELAEFTIAGEKLYNLTLKSLTGQPITAILRNYFDMRTTDLKGDIFILEKRILQCKIQSASPVIQPNQTFIGSIKNKLKSLKGEIQLTWGIPENLLLVFNLVNIIIHAYSLGFIWRVRTYKKLVRNKNMF